MKTPSSLTPTPHPVSDPSQPVDSHEEAPLVQEDHVRSLLSSLECPVCYETYNESSNAIPCTLPCGHSLCIRHIPRLQQCPLCRFEISNKSSIFRPSIVLMEIAKVTQQLAIDMDFLQPAATLLEEDASSQPSSTADLSQTGHTSIPTNHHGFFYSWIHRLFHQGQQRQDRADDSAHLQQQEEPAGANTTDASLPSVTPPPPRPSLPRWTASTNLWSSLEVLEEEEDRQVNPMPSTSAPQLVATNRGTPRTTSSTGGTSLMMAAMGGQMGDRDILEGSCSSFMDDL